MGSSRLEHSNIKFNFFGGFFNCDVLFSKIIENYIVFFLRWVLCTSLLNQIRGPNLNSCTLIMRDVEVFSWGLDSKLQYNGPCKIS
jgi:hypothetical protein